jgi:hypothetical protein
LTGYSGITCTCTAEAAREQREVELEGVEKAINSLRNEAHALEERRNELLSKLDRILAQSEGTETESVDKSDRIAQTHMLKRRCLEVDIKFSIQRTEGQEGTLKEVNTQLYELDQLSPPSWLFFFSSEVLFYHCCMVLQEPWREQRATTMPAVKLILNLGVHLIFDFKVF